MSGYGSENLEASTPGSDHGPLRDSPMIQNRAGPNIPAFMFIPWLCAVIVVLWTLIIYGSGLFWILLPVFLICISTALFAHIKYRKEQQRQAEGKPDDPYNATWPEVMLCLLCFASTCVAGIIVLVAYLHFLQPYHKLGEGATYLNVLPSQSALGASDATALVFAVGTQVDTARSYGFSDVQNGGGMYCVAPLANTWTEREPRVQFFAAGTDCCSQKGSFGCGSASGRGAEMIATESTAAQGYKSAVEGAASEHGIQPQHGYLLLHMVSDPMALRQSMWENAVKLMLVFVVVYLFLSCIFGYFAHNSAKSGTPK